MTNKKELNASELDKVSAGTSEYAHGYYWNYRLGDRVEIKEMGYTIGSHVKARGIYNNDPLDDCYYLEAIKSKEQMYNGWYSYETMFYRKTWWDKIKTTWNIQKIDGD